MAWSVEHFTNDMLASGQVGNPQVGTYVGQCVSLVQQYLYLCYGVNYAPRGNAKDFIPPKFHRVNREPKAGDIVRYGANYGGGYGHIGMMTHNGEFLDQNGTVTMRVAKRSKPFSGYDAVFEPDNPAQLFNAPQGGYKLPWGHVKQVATYEATATMNIRREPSLNGEIVATLAPGEKVTYDSYIDVNGFRWVSYIGYSGNRNFIARRNFSNGEIYGECY